MASLTFPHANTNRAMDICQESRKATFKFRRIGNGTVIGPTLTIGQNGGFQWIGYPSCISSTMSQAFNHMSAKMSSTQFRQILSRSKIGTLFQYPSGIAKR